MANAVFEPNGVSAPASAGAFTNIIGMAISGVILLGVVVWGAQTLLRDASGVPVVRVLDGPMRVAPEEPGGTPAAHQGLTVNEIASSQVRPEMRDDLQLAPPPIDLAAAVAPVLDEPALPPVADETAVTPAPVADADPVVAAETGTIDPSIPGVARSLRPALRPNLAPQQPATAAAAPALDLTEAQITPGTRLAQLGAYPSVDVARRQWEVFASKYSDFFEGKQRVIQEASSGGKTFYRLRVAGFPERGDARRFCSALAGQGADCYPVVMR